MTRWWVHFTVARPLGLNTAGDGFAVETGGLVWQVLLNVLSPVRRFQGRPLSLEACPSRLTLLAI